MVRVFSNEWGVGHLLTNLGPSVCPAPVTLAAKCGKSPHTTQPQTQRTLQCGSHWCVCCLLLLAGGSNATSLLGHTSLWLPAYPPSHYPESGALCGRVQPLAPGQSSRASDTMVVVVVVSFLPVGGAPPTARTGAACIRGHGAVPGSDRAWLAGWPAHSFICHVVGQLVLTTEHRPQVMVGRH